LPDLSGLAIAMTDQDDQDTISPDDEASEFADAELGGDPDEDELGDDEFVAEIDDDELAEGDDVFVDDTEDTLLVADPVEVEEEPAAGAAPRPAARRGTDDKEEEEEEDLDPDDVEADLDTILKDRLEAYDETAEDEEEEEVAATVAEEGDLPQKKEGEFPCPSCFLLVSAKQVARSGYCPHCGDPISVPAGL